MIALTSIDVINQTNTQGIEIATQTPQDIVVTNATDEQSISIEQDYLQEIDIDSVMLSQEIDVKQDGITINVYDVPFYEGECRVTPKFTEQTLPTAQKILKEDVRVEKIPYYEVSNISGGTTVTIG